MSRHIWCCILMSIYVLHVSCSLLDPVLGIQPSLLMGSWAGIFVVEENDDDTVGSVHKLAVVNDDEILSNSSIDQLTVDEYSDGYDAQLGDNYGIAAYYANSEEFVSPLEDLSVEEYYENYNDYYENDDDDFVDITIVVSPCFLRGSVESNYYNDDNLVSTPNVIGNKLKNSHNSPINKDLSMTKVSRENKTSHVNTSISSFGFSMNDFVYVIVLSLIGISLSAVTFRLFAIIQNLEKRQSLRPLDSKKYCVIPVAVHPSLSESLLEPNDVNSL